MIIGLFKLIALLIVIYFVYSSYKQISEYGYSAYATKVKAKLKNWYGSAEKSVSNFLTQLGK